jgi:hypothetical protein
MAISIPVAFSADFIASNADRFSRTNAIALVRRRLHEPT